MVKEDVKKMRKYTKDLYNDSDSDSQDEVTRTEDKIYYGSDSDTSQEGVDTKHLPSKLRNWDEKSSDEESEEFIDENARYIAEYYDDELYYGEDGESDLDDIENQGSDTVEMAFDEVT